MGEKRKDSSAAEASEETCFPTRRRLEKPQDRSDSLHVSSSPLPKLQNLYPTSGPPRNPFSSSDGPRGEGSCQEEERSEPPARPDARGVTPATPPGQLAH